MDDVPRRFMSFIAIFSGGIEPKVVSGGLSQEMGAVEKGFNLIEFVFDQAVSGFHIRLPGMGTGGDGLVTQAGDGFHGLGEGAFVLGLPAADEFGAVVRLEAASL
jgi:hypothetical protein